MTPPPSCTAGVVGITAAALAAATAMSALLTIPAFSPIVFAVTLVAAALIGLPLFALIRRAERHRGAKVAAAGFLTGAALPGWFLLSEPALYFRTLHDALESLAGIAGFGIAGSITAVLAWGFALLVDRIRRSEE